MFSRSPHRTCHIGVREIIAPHSVDSNAHVAYNTLHSVNLNQIVAHLARLGELTARAHSLQYASLAQVAEWHTRQVEGLCPSWAWRFESSPGHK